MCPLPPSWLGPRKAGNRRRGAHSPPPPTHTCASAPSAAGVVFVTSHRPWCSCLGGAGRPCWREVCPGALESFLPLPRQGARLPPPALPRLCPRLLNHTWVLGTGLLSPHLQDQPCFLRTWSVVVGGVQYSQEPRKPCGQGLGTPRVALASSLVLLSCMQPRTEPSEPGALGGTCPSANSILGTSSATFRPCLCLNPRATWGSSLWYLSVQGRALCWCAGAAS